MLRSNHSRRRSLHLRHRRGEPRPRDDAGDLAGWAEGVPRAQSGAVGRIRAAAPSSRAALADRSASTGKLLTSVASSIPVNPSPPNTMQHREAIEGVKDHPRTAGVEELGAGGAPSSGVNIARNLSRGAPKVFEHMSQRATGLSSVFDVPLEAGEVWERAPETVIRDGSLVHGIFSSPTHGSSVGAAGASEPVQQVTAKHNAANTQRLGTKGGTVEDLYADAGGAGRAATVPGPAGGAAGLHSAVISPVQRADSARLPRAAISPSDGLEGSLSDLWQDGNAVSNSRAVGSEGGTGSGTSGGFKTAQIWADCGTAGTDFWLNDDATDFDSIGGQSRGQGVVEEGHFDSTLGIVGGVGVTRTLNADQLKGATQLRHPTNATNQRNTAADRSSAWGRPPGPTQTGFTGGWSPDYRDAFPSLRGVEVARDEEQPGAVWEGARMERGEDASKRKSNRMVILYTWSFGMPAQVLL